MQLHLRKLKIFFSNLNLKIKKKKIIVLPKLLLINILKLMQVNIALKLYIFFNFFLNHKDKLYANIWIVTSNANLNDKN